MPTTTVTETSYTGPDGEERTQYRTTIPKELAEAFELGGTHIEWTVETGSALRIEKVE